MGKEYTLLEAPLPKPTSEAYASARILEALAEARLALKFLNEGLTRNAAGKVFQAWRALLAALLRLELDKLMRRVKSEEERKWLSERAVPRLPTTRLKVLSQLLEKIGHTSISAWTDKALNLHDYQNHGPDPDLALSKYRSREEAAYDIIALASEIIRRVEQLKARLAWSDEHERELEMLKRELRESLQGEIKQ
ncbi:PaREP1 family protein [Pyrolobus fumarii 1A]|uniref:PaREP1 family protein n=1 Tax=Pyrolobus fumarii (strain DSM 11204 / 1A) TaxID=694429 RepID=G0EGQ1_PYRF1|nr:PaREP1 family protein [Pyrolobus fumarii]AEM39199.1 PaREP1 family protein [Pyrolobus fumarii 1A]